MPENPRKLRDILDNDFLPTRPVTKRTEWQYRHAVKALAISLGYQPTARDLRDPVLDWLENRLTIQGKSRSYISEVLTRLRILWFWIATRSERGAA